MTDDPVKYHQHDADPAADDHTAERTYVDPAEHDAVWADAMTPEEYVLSSPEAMASAVEQAGR